MTKEIFRIEVSHIYVDEEGNEFEVEPGIRHDLIIAPIKYTSPPLTPSMTCELKNILGYYIDSWFYKQAKGEINNGN